MPAFGGRLTDSEVMKIASYVLEQAEKKFPGLKTNYKKT
jgi:mono/diheme cytochrome c family protein